MSWKSTLPFILSALIPGAATAFAAAQAAKVGESYIVSGRCVTVTRIENGQAGYKWSSGNASGSGNLPANRLTQSCNAPPPAAAPAGAVTGGLALTPAEAKAMVDAHNAIRARAGVGPVTWDPAVAAFAQRYVATLATSCAPSHSIWATEKPMYRGGGGPFSEADSAAAGHYAQVVWRNSIRIGCGRVACLRNGTAWTLVSCDYSPSGNEIGARAY